MRDSSEPQRTDAVDRKAACLFGECRGSGGFAAAMAVRDENTIRFKQHGNKMSSRII